MDIQDNTPSHIGLGEDSSRALNTPLRQQSLRAKKIRHATKWTFLVGTMVLALFGGTIFGKLYWGNKFFRKIVGEWVGNPLHTDPLGSFKPDVQFTEKHTLTVMLLGCDHDYSEVLMNHPLKNSRGRSDAIMIARLDFDAKTINILSIPRDTAVRIEKHGVRKINAAHQYGGPELLISTVKNVFGIDVDYYATIDFEGFQKMVDAVGGVDVDVHKRLKYTDKWGGLFIDLQPGLQHLDGYKAMGYVRMRHSDSDFERAKRQHEFLEALRGRIQDPKNILKTLDALKALTDSIKSNMTDEQMITLANFARSLPHEQIHLETLPCDEGPSYVYIKVNESEKMIRALFPGTLVSIEAPSKRELARMPKTPKEEKEADDKAAVKEKKPADNEPLLDDTQDPRMDEPTRPTDNSTDKKTEEPAKDGGKEPPKTDGDKPKEDPKKVDGTATY